MFPRPPGIYLWLYPRATWTIFMATSTSYLDRNYGHFHRLPGPYLWQRRRQGRPGRVDQERLEIFSHFALFIVTKIFRLPFIKLSNHPTMTHQLMFNVNGTRRKKLCATFISKYFSIKQLYASVHLSGSLRSQQPVLKRRLFF